MRAIVAILAATVLAGFIAAASAAQHTAEHNLPVFASDSGPQLNVPRRGMTTFVITVRNTSKKIYRFSMYISPKIGKDISMPVIFPPGTGAVRDKEGLYFFALRVIRPGQRYVVKARFEAVQDFCIGYNIFVKGNGQRYITKPEVYCTYP